jgi:hypothetical protein
MACSQTELRTSGSIDLIRPPLSGPNSLWDDFWRDADHEQPLAAAA